MSTVGFTERLCIIDRRLAELNDETLNAEYKKILELSGTKLYLHLNVFEKKIGVK